MADQESNSDANLVNSIRQALADFNRERLQNELNSMISCTNDTIQDIEENWQLSQFWYVKETSDYLAETALNITKPDGKIALVACPSVYLSIKSISAEAHVKVFEIDGRFSKWGNDFIAYDYRSPLKIPAELKHSFDLVIMDPPFLSEDCLLKCAITGRFLSKGKIIVCTGAVMESDVQRFLQTITTPFKPKHNSNLQNAFSCYINFPLSEFSRN